MEVFEADKKFVTEFIEEYKNHPALWNVKSDISKNKHLRKLGYEALVMMCKGKLPKVDEAFVKSKITNMRIAFKRELTKGRKSTHTGASTDDTYIPTLWYYNLLFFTSEYETGSDGICSTDDDTILVST